MNIKISYLALITGFFAINTVQAVEGVNPFYPLHSSSTGNATNAYGASNAFDNRHPLQQHQVKDYTLMGVIASQQKQMALIRTANAEEYFVGIDDLLGDANGKISKITGAGVEITEDNKIISLTVRNRSLNNEKTK
jgi:type IV pilus assembly protein PilP